jgi:hypothetical protein
LDRLALGGGVPGVRPVEAATVLPSWAVGSWGCVGLSSLYLRAAVSGDVAGLSAAVACHVGHGAWRVGHAQGAWSWRCALAGRHGREELTHGSSEVTGWRGLIRRSPRWRHWGNCGSGRWHPCRLRLVGGASGEYRRDAGVVVVFDHADPGSHVALLAGDAVRIDRFRELVL